MEIDHLSLKSKFCMAECWEKSRLPLRPVSCGVCRADLVDGRRSAFCSDRCRAIDSGLIEPLPFRACALPECGQEFLPWLKGQRCCSEKHGKVLYNRESRAAGKQKTEWNDRRRDSYHRRKALKKGASTGRPVRLAEIAERDAWRCSLCKQPVDPLVKWPHPKSPSLDHRIPLSRGGAHDPSNVDLAHLGCNTAKNNRVDEEQPRLAS